jgi:hypothetical protein
VLLLLLLLLLLGMRLLFAPQPLQRLEHVLFEAAGGHAPGRAPRSVVRRLLRVCCCCTGGRATLAKLHAQAHATTSNMNGSAPA